MAVAPRPCAFVWRTRLPISTLGPGYTPRQGREGRRTRKFNGVSLSKPPRFLPIGKVLVHNHVKSRLDSRGFRAWLADPDEKYEICICGWAPHLEHYKVKRSGNAGFATHHVIHPSFRAASRHRPLCRDVTRFGSAVQREELASQNSAGQTADSTPGSRRHEAEESDVESGRGSLHG